MPAHSRSTSQSALQSLPALLSNLVGRHATGFVVASSPRCQRDIIMIDGEVRAARSTLEEEMLGLWLVGNGTIRETERARALLAQGRTDAPPLGHVLVTQGLIQKEALEKHLQELALVILERATTEADVRLDFREDPEAEHLDTLGDLTTTHVILSTARSLQDVESMKNTLGDVTQMVSADSDLQAILEDLALTPTEAFLFSRLDSPRDLGALYRHSSLPEDQAIPTVFGLAMAGLITLSPAEDLPLRNGGEGTGPGMGPRSVDVEKLSQRRRTERQTIQKLVQEANQVNHYEALGVARDAAPVEILDAWNATRERYRSERTQEHHLVDAGAWLDTIRERALAAYQVLGDGKTRRRYDKVLSDIDKEQKSLTVTKRETNAGARSNIVVANLKRANELVKQGEIHLAVQLLEQACAIEPRPQELVKLARLQVRNPLWESRVLKCLRQAIDVDPYFIDAWLELAEFWRRRRDQERQRKALEKILAIEPDHERATLMYRQLVGTRPLDRLRRLAKRAKW